MVWTIFDKFAVIGTIVAILGFFINIWYTWKSTKSPQPKVRISRITTKTPWAEREKLDPVITLLILIRNTGDRSTFLSFNMQLTVLTLHKGSFKSKKIPFETEMQAEQNLPKAFSFEMPKDASAWWFISVNIKGYYLNTRDKKEKIRFEAVNIRKNIEWKKPKRVRWFHSVWLEVCLLKIRNFFGKE